MLRFCCLFAALAIFGQFASSQLVYSPVVNAPAGNIRGHLVNVKDANDDVYEFTGIPYAESPVDSGLLFKTYRRYAKPTPKAKFNRAFDAIKLPAQCPQMKASDLVALFVQPVEDSEDCLSLNVFVPKRHLDATLKPTNKPAPLPVFVWIYGGGFATGASTLTIYNGTTYAGHQNVIFVSIQYRIGPLGFAYLGTKDAPGNQGLWDQLEALKWVKTNIPSFGGDPAQVTIAGESAGAASVALHLLSPHSRGLFSKAIIESASALSSWATMTKEAALDRTTRIAKPLRRLSGPLLRCRSAFPKDLDFNVSSIQELIPSLLPFGTCLLGAQGQQKECEAASSVNGTSANILNCLRGALAKELVMAQLITIDLDRETVSPGLMTIPWVPVVDGDFIPRDPRQMLADGDFAKVPILIGSNKDDGSMFIKVAPVESGYFPNMNEPVKSFEKFTQATFRQMVDSYFVYYPVNGKKSEAVVRDAIEMQYWRTPDELNQVEMYGDLVADQVKNMIGDEAIICPALNWANGYYNSSPVYHYYFAHRAKNSPNPEFFGVSHGDEMPFVLGDGLNQNEPFSQIEYTETDRILSRRMVQYWTNFVKTGNPNTVDPTLPNQLPLPEWPAYSPYGYTFEIVDKCDTQRLIKSYKARDCEFWAKDLPELYEQVRDSPALPVTTPKPCPKFVYVSAASPQHLNNMPEFFLLALFALLARLF